MRDQIQGRLANLQRAFASFSAGQKTIAVIGGLALLVGGFLVFNWAAAPAYAPLYSGLAPADASAVIDKLNAQGTPYQITGGGTTIEVPQADVYNARIQLSGQGLPSQSSDGYSLLDKQGLSTSQFQQNVDYKRAIEGELQKTIDALDPVSASIVHVALPQQQLFQTDKQPTTASVLVSLKPGQTLESGQVQAVVHLVASSVEGLDPKNVTVTDSQGHVLSTAGSTLDAVGNTRLEQVQAFEQKLKDGLQAQLDQVLGPGNSSVQINANLNFDQTTTHTTRYFTTPNAVPLSASKTTEKYTTPGGSAAAGGVVGPNGTITTGSNAANGKTNYAKTDQTSDNAVGSEVIEATAAPGNVTSLGANVVINSSSANGKNVAAVQKMVTSALSLNTKRGDTLNVSSMPFDTTAQKAAAKELAAANAANQMKQYMSWGKTAGLVLLVVVMLFMAWRRSKKRDKMREQATTYVVEQLRQQREPIAATPVAQPAELISSDGADLRLAARDEISALVEKQPEEVAQLLRGWLVESGS